MKHFFLFVLILLLSQYLHAQLKDKLRVSGYVQGNPVFIKADFPQPIGEQIWWEYRLQNRLNLRWNPVKDLNFHAQMRTRFFAGDLVKEIPGYAQAINTDDGIVNLSWLVVDRETWFLHYIPDRLYAEWNPQGWNIRVGRQRVNWGINMITNPNDIFNIYSFYDFDYPERPGSDAVRVQRYFGVGKRLELAVSPDRNLEQSVAAALYAFNFKGYDIQLISGYYKERFTAGGGWAGDLKGVGLKGETMFYIDINETNRERSTNFVGAVSLDYMFQNSLFGIFEFLYNHAGGRDQFSLLAEDISPDNPSFSRYQLTTMLSYPIHPLLDGSLATIYYPDESAVFISPSITWSVIQDLDFQLLGQFFVGSDDSVFGNGITLVTASLKYSF